MHAELTLAPGIIMAAALDLPTNKGRASGWSSAPVIVIWTTIRRLVASCWPFAWLPLLIVPTNKVRYPET